MKIQIKIGNLLHVSSGHIVHGCNAQGVMGSGVALAVKKIYPGAFESYHTEYKKNGLVLGECYPHKINEKLFIWNAITQGGFGSITRNVSYDAIQTCFQEINDFVALAQPNSNPPQEIHIPFIGAGLGGGRWYIIRSIIEDTVQFPVTVWSIDGKMPDGSLVDLTNTF